MKPKSRNTLKLIIRITMLAIGIPVLFYIIFKMAEETYHFEYYGSTTYGVVDSILIDKQGDKSFYYSFKINSKNIVGSNIENKKATQFVGIGDSFMVNYSYKKPSICRMDMSKSPPASPSVE